MEYFPLLTLVVNILELGSFLYFNYYVFLFYSSHFIDAFYVTYLFTLLQVRIILNTPTK